MWVLQKWQIWQEFIKGLLKIKTRWQNRHVDKCGLYENDKCCKVCKFGKDSSKVCENCLLMISNFYKNSNLGENGEFGKNLSKVWQKLRQDDKRRMSLIVGFTKPFFRNQWILGKIHRKFDKIQMRQKGASCTNSHYKKMANLGDKGKFWQKWCVLKIHQGFGQIFKKY